MVESPHRGSWIRNRRRNRWFAVIWGGLGIATAIVDAVFVAIPIRDGDYSAAAVLGVVFSALAGYSVRYAIGCRSAGLMLTESMAVIKNPWRTYSVPLADVVAFAAGRQAASLGNPTPGVILRRRDGRVYSVWTLAREGLVWNTGKNVEEWEGVVESLNDLVDLKPTTA